MNQLSAWNFKRFHCSLLHVFLHCSLLSLLSLLQPSEPGSQPTPRSRSRSSFSSWPLQLPGIMILSWTHDKQVGELLMENDNLPPSYLNFAKLPVSNSSPLSIQEDSTETWQLWSSSESFSSLPGNFTNLFICKNLFVGCPTPSSISKPVLRVSAPLLGLVLVQELPALGYPIPSWAYCRSNVRQVPAARLPGSCLKRRLGDGLQWWVFNFSTTKFIQFWLWCHMKPR